MTKETQIDFKAINYYDLFRLELNTKLNLHCEWHFHDGTSLWIHSRKLNAWLKQIAGRNGYNTLD